MTLRDETEWVELMDAGRNRLWPPSSYQSVQATMLDALQYQGLETNPYGAGDAAKRIAVEIVRGLQ